ncbi:MAG: UDP-N-acetylmuramoyl-L-alanine--D-glutamate ligase, partial [Bacilli bacterium]|nr:UDP-N-acetylmuramoyl-L-alanine--D-glutamate ligase [Bacilli bacterium]
MLENKKIFILGMAKSGYEVAKLLHATNEIVICDGKMQDSDKIKELESLGIKFYQTDEPESMLDETYDILIKNPAVFSYHPCVRKAVSLNIPVVNEMEVAYHYIKEPVKIIGVTGSNGKTTTTTLIYEVLKKAGVSVKLGGNIGTPLSAIVSSLEANDILLLEISDHQLNDFKEFKTDISILTNICPTHLDYHGSYEAYKNTKKKIFNHHSENDIAIINKANYDAFDLTKDIPSTTYYFNDNN